MKKLNELKKTVLEQYRQELASDPENEDAVFFILEEVGEDLSSSDFDKLCKMVDEAL